MKVILLAVLVGIVIWYLAFRKQNELDAPARKATEEKMVACAYCGVNLPESEAVLCAEKRYCCDEHRKLDAP